MLSVSEAKFGISSRARSSSITRISFASRQTRISPAVCETAVNARGGDFGRCAGVSKPSAAIPKIAIPMRPFATDDICPPRARSQKTVSTLDAPRETIVFRRQVQFLLGGNTEGSQGSLAELKNI